MDPTYTDAKPHSLAANASFTDVTSLLLPQYSTSDPTSAESLVEQKSWSKRFHIQIWPRRRVTSLFGLLLCLAISLVWLQTARLGAQSPSPPTRLGSRQSRTAFSRINLFARQPIAEPPTDFVSLWQNEPFPEGYMTQPMNVAANETAAVNVTAVMGTLRSAVVERHIPGQSSIDENSVSLRFFFATWDLPLNPDRHQQPSKLFGSNWKEYSYNVTVSSPDVSANGVRNRTYSGRRHYQDMREIAFRMEKALFDDFVEDLGARITVKLDLLFKGKVAGTWDFKLQQNSYPYTRLAICIKPLYGVSKPGALAECRFPAHSAVKEHCLHGLFQGENTTVCLASMLSISQAGTRCCSMRSRG